MAAAPTGAPEGAYFRDLQRIRASKDISIDALHEETKIPLNLLEEFEATGLAEHPMFNRVYLRSLVRAYADGIGLDEERALAAMEEELAGTYSGGLAMHYLDEAPAQEGKKTTEEAPPKAAAPTEEPAETDADEETNEAAVVAEKDASREPIEPPADETATEAKEQSRLRPVGRQEAESPSEGRREQRGADGAAAGGAAGTWDTQSPSPSSQRREPIDMDQRRSLMQWGLVVVAVLVCAGIIWGIFALVSGDGSEPTAQREPVAAEDTTTRLADTTTAPPSQPEVTLGDTMNVVVVAQEPVAAIRITRDDDLRRPYWIEEGEAKAFPAIERIVLEEKLDLIRLFLEGYEYPTNRRDDQGRIVITRASAESFLDTLSGPPADITGQPETVQKGPIQEQ